MKLTHNPNKVQSSTSIQQHIVNQEIFVIKVFCHYSSMPIIKNMKTSQMAQVHHLLVIFWILQDCYLLPLVVKVWLEISAVLTLTGPVYHPKLASKPVGMV